MQRNLDAKRAARAEAHNEPHEVVFGGETFAFPARIPLEALELMAEAKFRAGFRVLLDDEEQVERFFAHRPDADDLEEVMGLYGQPGESSASPSSSPNGGRPQSRTGKRTTAAT